MTTELSHNIVKDLGVVQCYVAGVLPGQCEFNIKEITIGNCVAGLLGKADRWQVQRCRIVGPASVTVFARVVSSGISTTVRIVDGHDRIARSVEDWVAIMVNC